MKSILTCLVALSFLSGCMLGPSKDVPDLSLADSFVEEETSSVSPRDISTWWEQFDDPLLDSLMQKVLSSNFNLQLAQEKVHEIRANYRMESSLLWPSLDAFGAVARLRKSQKLFDTAAAVSPVSIIGKPVQSLFIGGFDASWEIDFFGKNRSAKQAAYYQVLSAEEQVHQVQITVVAELASLYSQMRALQQRIVIVKKRILTQLQILALSEELYVSGLVDEIEIEQQRSSLASDESLLPNLVSALKQTQYQIAVLMGEQPEKMQEEFEKTKPIPMGLQKVPAGIPSDLLRRRPDIRKAERDLFSACAKVGQAKADLFPTVALTGIFGGASAHADDFFSKQSQFWAIFPTVNWNLFQGWKTVSNIKVQKSRHKQTVLTYEQTVLTALQEVESSLVAYFEEDQKLLSLTEEVKAKKRIHKLTSSLYGSGLKNLSEVLSTQKKLLDSQDQYLISKVNVITNLIAVYKALGGGWEAPLEPSSSHKPS